jgi:hypothetical protein
MGMVKNSIFNNRRAWIKIVEAFIAVLLIAGVLLIVISQGYIKTGDISSQVYDSQISILREIQLNENLRDLILNAEGTLPIEWDNFPPQIKQEVNQKIPDYLECTGKICEADKECYIEEQPKKDVYAQSIVITTTLKTDPEKQLRRLKLFCWKK